MSAPAPQTAPTTVSASDRPTPLMMPKKRQLEVTPLSADAQAALAQLDD